MAGSWNCAQARPLVFWGDLSGARNPRPNGGQAGPFLPALPGSSFALEAKPDTRPCWAQRQEITPRSTPPQQTKAGRKQSMEPSPRPQAPPRVGPSPPTALIWGATVLIWGEGVLRQEGKEGATRQEICVQDPPQPLGSSCQDKAQPHSPLIPAQWTQPHPISAPTKHTHPQGATAAPAGVGGAAPFPGHLLPDLGGHRPTGQDRTEGHWN